LQTRTERFGPEPSGSVAGFYAATVINPLGRPLGKPAGTAAPSVRVCENRRDVSRHMTRNPTNTNKGRTRTHRYRKLTDEEIAELLGVEYTSPEYRQKHGGGGSE
jgi:hypothetical protein